MEKGKLIVIDGLDGNGKATQAQLLADALKNLGLPVKKLSFPRYGNSSCGLVEAYLRGDYGTDSCSVNAYAASLFYAVDRIASYFDDWGKDHEAGSIMIADRYTTSNMIYQGAKLDGKDRPGFLSWLEDVEYDKGGLPRPDITFFLDVEDPIAEDLRIQRAARNHTEMDIHERNKAFMDQSRAAGLEIAKHMGWTFVHCTQDGKMRPIIDIHEEILRTVLDLLGLLNFAE